VGGFADPNLSATPASLSAAQCQRVIEAQAGEIEALRAEVKRLQALLPPPAPAVAAPPAPSDEGPREEGLAEHGGVGTA
jgi:hypothetical protein